MGLKDKKSKFDRHHLGEEGNNVGTTPPGDGPFFTDDGSSNSPFKSNDHMIDLLNNAVTTQTGNAYQAVPHTATFLKPLLMKLVRLSNVLSSNL